MNAGLRPRPRRPRFELTREERQAWDRYVAAFAGQGPTHAMRMADMVLTQRITKFRRTEP